MLGKNGKSALCLVEITKLRNNIPPEMMGFS